MPEKIERKNVAEVAGTVQAAGMQAQSLDVPHGAEVIVLRRPLKPLEIPTAESAQAIAIPAGCMLLVLDPATAMAVRAHVTPGASN